MSGFAERLRFAQLLTNDAATTPDDETGDESVQAQLLTNAAATTPDDETGDESVQSVPSVPSVPSVLSVQSVPSRLMWIKLLSRAGDIGA